MPSSLGEIPQNDYDERVMTRLQFLGATGTVTGSRFFLRHGEGGHQRRQRGNSMLPPDRSWVGQSVAVPVPASYLRPPLAR
jgi:hypothetical protein